MSSTSEMKQVGLHNHNNISLSVSQNAAMWIKTLLETMKKDEKEIYGDLFAYYRTLEILEHMSNFCLPDQT
jgi:hypothetical protein